MTRLERLWLLFTLTIFLPVWAIYPPPMNKKRNRRGPTAMQHAFLQVIEEAKHQRWPRWMRRASYTATAHLPRNNERQS